ncbi:hypothetical protein DPMN_007220 [Dreissena polymorpha]|uniref:Uncharacterized protein n=1 Tax=Dreissena polymorpha TaxID=45954 RepID=A0A9D4MVH5_DREPO|nr:hypothetical protein DPMN_007220 [Dreissena polymorpha]
MQCVPAQGALCVDMQCVPALINSKLQFQVINCKLKGIEFWSTSTATNDWITNRKLHLCSVVTAKQTPLRGARIESRLPRGEVSVLTISLSQQ